MVEERVVFNLAYEKTSYNQSEIENVIKSFNLHEIGTASTKFVDVYPRNSKKPLDVKMIVRTFWAGYYGYLDMKNYLDTKFLGKVIVIFGMPNNF